MLGIVCVDGFIWESKTWNWDDGVSLVIEDLELGFFCLGDKSFRTFYFFLFPFGSAQTLESLYYSYQYHLHEAEMISCRYISQMRDSFLINGVDLSLGLDYTLIQL